jgi:hypothetical protein
VTLINKKERNESLLAIQRAGLDPRDFEPPREVERGVFSKFEPDMVVIVHKPSRAEFSMGPLQQARPEGMRIASANVGRTSLFSKRRARWVALFEEWLSALAEWQREEIQPDLWSQLADQDAVHAATASNADNAPFTINERAEIVAALNEFAAYAKTTYELSATETAELNGHLDNLAALTAKLGKRDWLTMAAGVCVILQTVLPADAPQHLFGMVVKVVAHLLGAPPHLSLTGG